MVTRTSKQVLSPAPPRAASKALEINDARQIGLVPRKNDSDRAGLELTTWEMACHALTNWATYRVTQQLSGWVWVLKPAWAARDPAEADTKLACSMRRVWRAQGTGWGRSMGPYSQHHSHHCRPLHQRLVNEITFATRLTMHPQQKIILVASYVAKLV